MRSRHVSPLIPKYPKSNSSSSKLPLLPLDGCHGCCCYNSIHRRGALPPSTADRRPPPTHSTTAISLHARSMLKVADCHGRCCNSSSSSTIADCPQASESSSRR
ncbi:hypothetical protein Dimus_039384 [Dionaea muscipula]